MLGSLAAGFSPSSGDVDLSVAARSSTRLSSTSACTAESSAARTYLGLAIGAVAHGGVGMLLQAMDSRSARRALGCDGMRAYAGRLNEAAQPSSRRCTKCQVRRPLPVGRRLNSVAWVVHAAECLVVSLNVKHASDTMLPDRQGRRALRARGATTTQIAAVLRGMVGSVCMCTMGPDRKPPAARSVGAHWIPARWKGRGRAWTPKKACPMSGATICRSGPFSFGPTTCSCCRYRGMASCAVAKPLRRPSRLLSCPSRRGRSKCSSTYMHPHHPLSPSSMRDLLCLSPRSCASE